MQGFGANGQAEVNAESLPPLNTTTPEDEAVLVELRRLDERTSWTNAILLLVISLVLFVGASRREEAWKGLLILLGVLLVHEGGHYLAMRCFGYRNLRMFFIPFLGAAVSGRHYNVAGWQKALVALAGPVPGIFLGVPIGIVGVVLPEPNLVQISLMLLGLNGFNLLPFLPLDGGWVVHSLLFVRHPMLDAVFRVVAALGLLAISILMGMWLLAGVAVFMLIAVPVAWRLSKITHQLRDAGLSANSADSESIPDATALTILTAIRSALPPQTTPKVMAQSVADVFSALNASPPGALMTLVLLALHAGTFVLAVVMTLGILISREALK